MPNGLRHIPDALTAAGRRSFTVLLGLVVLGVAAAAPDPWRLDAAPALFAAQTTGSTVSPDRAAPFLGEWSAPVASQMGPMTFGVSVKVEGGNVVATVSGGVFPPATASEISLVGRNLFLKYVSDFQGMSIRGLVAMTPQGPDMLLTISLLDGQMEMAGTATRGGAGAGATAGGRQGGRGGATAAAGGGRGPARQPQVPRVTDVMQMLAALPESAPATPKQPRTVLVLARAAGFVHASIPLAARTIEALGQKTGAWNTVITYDAADINERNLQQYDAIFLASTTGLFLDDPADQAVSAARRKALLDFVRGGKGIVAVHAATDSYHGAAPGAAAAAAPALGSRPAVDGGAPVWPEFNRLIGGYFKYHWLYPTQIAVRIDDPESPVNAAFTSLNKQTGVRLPRPFAVTDEVYTFNESSWSRDRAHVLTSIDYARMPAEIKAQEPAPQRADHDYALSYIQREGKGRVFVEVLGHDESIYKIPSMLAHILAGVQYALGDLQTDDSPTNPAKP